MSPADAEWNRPTARDIPPGPVIERFPLYPGAVPSGVAMPPHAVIGILPSINCSRSYYPPSARPWKTLLRLSLRQYGWLGEINDHFIFCRAGFE